MKLSPSIRSLATAAAFIALATTVQAHPGHDGGHELTWDFTAGALHPLGGLDHLLAMVAVGIWAACLGGRARWAIPAAFLGAMSAGAALGANGITFSWLEQSIAASVLAIGLLVVSSARLPLTAGIALTATFAILHGLAHGGEMPAGASGTGYALGFLATTALLHSIGLGLGSSARRLPTWTTRTAGAALVVAGGCLLAA